MPASNARNGVVDQEVNVDQMLAQGSFPDQNVNQSYINNAPLLGAGCHAPELPANEESERHYQSGRKDLHSPSRVNAVANSHILESGEEAEQERMDSSRGRDGSQAQEEDEPSNSNQAHSENLEDDNEESA